MQLLVCKQQHSHPARVTDSKLLAHRCCLLPCQALPAQVSAYAPVPGHQPLLLLPLLRHIRVYCSCCAVVAGWLQALKATHKPGVPRHLTGPLAALTVELAALSEAFTGAGHTLATVHLSGFSGQLACWEYLLLTGWAIVAIWTFTPADNITPTECPAVSASWCISKMQTVCAIWNTRFGDKTWSPAELVCVAGRINRVLLCYTVQAAMVRLSSAGLCGSGGVSAGRCCF